ncbi:MAG: hypothetical protein KA196_04240, partial [Arenimonas sp.]|nr:hypothetical protein [Arenimonas sp.]
GEQSVVLVLGEGVGHGLIPQPSGHPLTLQTDRDGIWLVEGGEAEPAFAAPSPDFLVPPRATKAQRQLRAQQDGLKLLPEPVVDVVVAYNATLVSVMGSDAAVQARIAFLEALSNQTYRDSQAEIQIRVVGVHLVDYADNNDNDDALGEITAGSALPIKAEIDRVRNQYGADLVMLLRNFDRAAQSSCGVGYILGYHGDPFNKNYGFSVVSDRGYGGDNCGEFTFAHELGHNMGGHHDTETEDGGYGAYTYSRGYRKTLAANSGFATVMAYTQSPQVRVGYFSNPRLSLCLSQPCGEVDQADNARGLTEAATALAGLVAAIPVGAEPSLSVADLTVLEGNAGNTTASVLVRLSAPAPGPVQFTLATSSGSAAAPVDYLGRVVAGTIPAGAVQASVDFIVRGDTVVEQDEVFAVSVSNVTGARVADGQGVVTIDNDEPIPDLTVADASVDEGNAGTTQLTFTASLSQASGTPVAFNVRSFNYAAGANSATEAEDFDHVSLDGVQIPAGATTAQFTVPVHGDATVEQDESFYLTLSGITAANLADGRAVGRIRNDDGVANRPAISIAPASVSEGNAGTRVASFSISLSQAATSAVRFGVATSDLTAQAGSDYEARLALDQTIAAGQSGATFSVNISGDTIAEPNELFNVTLQNVTGADIAVAQAAGTIVNDDDGLLPVFAARDDRWILRENAAATVINVRGNDEYDAARLAGGSLSITTAPAQGSATVQTQGTAGTAADDTVLYSPPANFSGEVDLGYRLCESAGRCVDGVLSLVLRPSVDVAIDSATGSGFEDRSLAGLRALPAAEFSATRLLAPEVISQVLAVDPSPESPWDAGRIGTQFVLRGIAPSADGLSEVRRVLVDARSLEARDVDLYLGLDLDADGSPDANELRCTAAMATPVERCELAITAQAPSVPYWVMAHNRSAASHSVQLDHWVVRLVPDDAGPLATGRLVATGAGRLPAGAAFPLRLGWTDLTLLPGERRLGYVQLRSDAATSAGLFPVRISRSAGDMPALALASGAPVTIALAPGASQDRIYIDVPAGATRLVATTTSPRNVDLYLASVPAAGAPAILAAPARSAAQATAAGASGNESINLSGAALVPGRWYVTVVNAGAEPASVAVRATVLGQAPVVRPGSYFNAQRGGHGLFLYPAGADLAGLWYTYLQDGSPTWYYLQGAAPGANGIWTAKLYRSAWTGTGNRLTEIGKAAVTPSGPDAFAFSYTLDGETGAEPLTALGRGCPSLSGAPLDVSSHWFNPATSGTGYSVQMFPGYEFYAAFVYDGLGVPRFLVAERSGFGGAQATLPLEQLAGFCPLCARTGTPSRRGIGTFTRRYADGSFANITLEGLYASPVSGTWAANQAVQALGGAGSTQGCVLP